jgi:hypothetical protein
MSDEDAGITGEVKTRFDEICRYYIGSKDERGKSHSGSCIGWLKGDNKFEDVYINEDEEAEYLEKKAKSFSPPKDEERKFGQRALRFVSNKEKEFSDKLESSELSDEVKREAIERFEKAKKDFFKKAGLFDLGELIAVGTKQDGERTFAVVNKYNISNLDGDNFILASPADEIESFQELACIDGDVVYCRSERDSESKPDSQIHAVNLKAMIIKEPPYGPIGVPINCVKAKNGVIYAVVDLSKKAKFDKMVRLNADDVYDMKRFADAVKDADYLPLRAKTFDVSEINGKYIVFASSFAGEIYKGKEDGTEMKPIVNTSLPLEQLKAVHGTDLVIGYSHGPVVLFDKDGRLKDNIPVKSRFFDAEMHEDSLLVLMGSKNGLELRRYVKPEDIFTKEGELAGENKDIKIEFTKYSRTGLYNGHAVLYRKDNSIEVSNNQQLSDFTQFQLEGNAAFSKNVFWRQGKW